MRRAGSEAEVDSGVSAGEGRADFSEVIEPGWLVDAGASEEGSVGGEAVLGGVAVVGEFGVDGAEAGVGELVLDVPFEASAEFGAEFFEGAFAAGDLGFGVADVVGESVDLVDGGGFVLTAVAAQL